MPLQTHSGATASEGRALDRIELSTGGDRYSVQKHLVAALPHGAADPITVRVFNLELVLS